MPPYLRLARQDASSSTSTSTDTSAGATGNDQSFMDKYSKEIYIGLAVLGVLILSYFLWAGTSHRLSFPPFSQKRCMDCKKGISKDKTEDEDYFKNDQENKKGWVCKECQEKREEKMLDRELKDGEEGKRAKTKKDDHNKKKTNKNKAASSKKEVVDSDDSSDDSEEDDNVEKRVVRKSVVVDKRKSRPPPISKRREEESEVEYVTDSEDEDTSDEEIERERRKEKDRRRR
ncbi:hypothetical protein L486_00763 [Kwoniella mangroviensis CBS 10435]|uniref:Uncharacterized protein n=1 Tax=Kwoniella mangroviensis CBS 10435 TaxID=1331196 RepID=A0A1B9J005_9TREE|nr:uncharacterized protein I203_04296 [Kwoniella mangroviensis CBS 8507]OCF61119.1 hypothetical protein L486_00763 [Kwoniella mangroviensis CBS 10435]OCF66720.1 hypothetical protein I203_04296 [Kwoniella mangroviensis CBS 8507]OCF74132.1 hypothetical protein I204_04502 [Kwoniella mangroviensis CBS 8886]